MSNIKLKFNYRFLIMVIRLYKQVISGRYKGYHCFKGRRVQTGLSESLFLETLTFTSGCSGNVATELL